MYPAEFEFKDTTESNTSFSYLCLFPVDREGRGKLCTSLYDKRDDFNFHINELISNKETRICERTFKSSLRKLYGRNVATLYSNITPFYVNVKKTLSYGVK